MRGFGSWHRLGASSVALLLLSCGSADPRTTVPRRVGDAGVHPLSVATGAEIAAQDGSTSEQPPPAAATCPSSVRPDPVSSDRDACHFVAGASVKETLAFMPPEHARIPLQHVIVLMKENRSYDHVFGKLFEHGQPESEPLPDTFMNLDGDGVEVHPYHAGTTCLKANPGHQWSAMHRQVDDGRMDGFIKTAGKLDAGHYVMSWYDDVDLPFYYFLANTFAIGDRNFASVRSGTWPNRDYLLLATSDGVRSTGGGHPSTSLPTVFSALTARGISWGAYAVGEPFEGALNWYKGQPGVSGVDGFLLELADGTLPQVAFVDSASSGLDEHPPSDIQEGEAWTHKIYQAARQSPLWPSLAIFFTYDEAGGFADHVPPPNSCVARPEDENFFELGVRVPLIVISRWARPHYVSHVVHEHTSILRLIELLFDLPALTARDANSDALLDMFDFDCPIDSIPEAPEPGHDGCK